VNGGSLLTPEEKGVLDDWYVAHASLRLDLRIFLLTLRSILYGDRKSDRAVKWAQTIVVQPESGMRRMGSQSPRIAFVNRYFYPDHSATSQILSDLAFHLSGQGRDVHVFTSRQRYDNAAAILPHFACFDGVTIHRVSTTQFGRAGLIGRAIDYFSFYWSVRRALLTWAHQGDVLVTKTDPPLLGILGLRIAKRRHMKLVNWLQDVYPEIAAHLDVPLMKGSLGRMMTRWRDSSLCAAKINVVVGERMAERLRARGIPAEKIEVIPNWSDDEHIRPIAQTENPLRRKWRLEGQFVVGYSGNLGRGHEFETVLKAAKILRHDPLLIFLFIGNSKKIDELRRLVRARGLEERFRFLPPQDRAELTYSLSVADVHLVSLQPELEGLMVPSKFYGIAAAGRPTIAITAKDGEVANLIRHYDCGVVVEPGDGIALADQLVSLIQNASEVEHMGRRARAMLDERFTRRIAMQHWSELLDQVLEPATILVRTDIPSVYPEAAAAMEAVSEG
jgi:glycosyltransferase involved in cell wall biosynthesis